MYTCVSLIAYISFVKVVISEDWICKVSYHEKYRTFFFSLFFLFSFILRTLKEIKLSWSMLQCCQTEIKKALWKCTF